LPKVVFVMGKGGVGRSTVSAALGLALARRGQRALVVEWTIADAIAPWFGGPPAAATPREVIPRLWSMNFRLDDVLRQYFVEHLHLGRFFEKVIEGQHVRRMIEAVPGLSELMFIGHLWWLTSLAGTEAGLVFDRVVVDAPATGHGASLLEMPALLASLDARGLLGVEVERVTAMMADPAHVGALVVTMPEDLAVAETLELVPRLTRALGRAPLGALVNRSAGMSASSDERPAWLGHLEARLSRAAYEALRTLHAELVSRARLEAELERALAHTTLHGTLALSDHLVRAGIGSPREVVSAVSEALDAWRGRGDA
jgi:anion-transporting  ArsA/GET3 family ATPase